MPLSEQRKKEYQRECKHGEMLHWKECAECREFMLRKEFDQELDRKVGDIREEIENLEISSDSLERISAASFFKKNILSLPSLSLTSHNKTKV